MIADTTYTARRLWQLGEWDAALAVLDADADADAGAGANAGAGPDAQLRAEIAVERWFFQWSGHDEAEQAVAALDQSTPAAQVLRARLAYSRLLFRRDPRPDDRAVAEAGYREAIGTGDALTRGWAEFHWGCLLDNIDQDADAAVPHYKTAFELAVEHRDPALESIAIRHLSHSEDPAKRLQLLRRSLHLRAALGIRPYTVAAQATLAAALPEDDPERADLTEAYLAGAAALGIVWLLAGGTGSTEDFED